MDKIDSEIKQDKKAEAKRQQQEPTTNQLEISSEIEFKPDECEVSLLRTGIENESEIDLELGNSKSRRMRSNMQQTE